VVELNFYNDLYNVYKVPVADLVIEFVALEKSAL